jgi:hypothetical protein
MIHEATLTIVAESGPVHTIPLHNAHAWIDLPAKLSADARSNLSTFHAVEGSALAISFLCTISFWR